MTLNGIANKVLMLLREPGANNDPSQPPTIPASSDYTLPTITADANTALLEILDDTGFDPMIQEKMVTSTIVAGLDYALPIDLLALTRVEYAAGANPGQPIHVPEATFDEFDRLTSAGYDLLDVGYPTVYRKPFGTLGAQTIRFFPQPVAGNVTALDKITLYYTSKGTKLALGTDVPGIPEEIHVAIVYRLLHEYWLKKEDDVQSQRYLFLYDRKIKNAKKLATNADRAGQPSFEDEEGVGSGSPLFTFT